MKKQPRTVADYIAQSPAWARPTLRMLRQTIRSAVPKATESISYRMPYYSHYGRLAYFAVFKQHCSFFWISAPDKKAFSRDLRSQNVVGSTLRIPAGSKVPVSLIKRILRSRAKANQARKR